LQGNVYHVVDFPALNGRRPKSRFVVVIHPPERLGDQSIFVTPASTSTLSPYRVLMPNLADSPACGSGLPRRCWAIPEESRLLARHDLIGWRGRVPGLMVKRIIEMFRKHDRDQPPEPK
jgi:hypothetical protein